ncbi:hypothetical protein [Nocardioides sp.]|uniref:hypothetical protein n=1 Tax=Nocardioides sp. TaxID=35761 RepID=UPI002ED799ED
MSTRDDEPTEGITDDLLPEDLRPTDDNPLAKPLTDEDDPKSPEELDMHGGKTPEESEGDAPGDAEGDEGHSED